MNPGAAAVTRVARQICNPKSGFIAVGKKKKAWLQAEADNPNASAREISAITGASVSSIYNWRWESRNPEKRSAHKAVEMALRSNAITKSACQYCGEAHAHAHHDDYSRPLDIKWLCDACHRSEHQKAFSAKVTS